MRHPQFVCRTTTVTAVTRVYRPSAAKSRRIWTFAGPIYLPPTGESRFGVGDSAVLHGEPEEAFGTEALDPS